MNRDPCRRRTPRPVKSGFTLIELLVVVAIVSVLVAVLIPSLARARLQAKVMQVRGELYQIALALETYHDEWKDYPWASAQCFGGGSVGEAYNRLPPELGPRYLGELGEDLFNPGQKYKYARYVGWNNGVPDSSIGIWVPKCFPYDRPDSDPREDTMQSRFRGGPVEYAVWSVGPAGDPPGQATSVQMCDIYRVPIPKRTWYSFSNGVRGQGVIPLIRTKKQGFVQWSSSGQRTTYKSAW